MHDAFVLPLYGFGALSLAQIVGEAGDLLNYANPAKVWKRFGLAVINGERQQKKTNVDLAALHGYSPRRHSIIFVISDSLLKKQNDYKALYDARKTYEVEKAVAAGLTVAPQAVISRKKDKEKYRSAGHIHMRSQRYVAKRLLRNVWRALRAAAGIVEEQQQAA